MTCTVARFADAFQFAGPLGSQSFRAADFALALPRRKQLFDRLGCQSTYLVFLHQTQLDVRYILVRTEWKLTFARSQGEPQQILVGSTIILDTGPDPFKIVFYLDHHDLMKVLKEHGILNPA
jgi:hypothetical protein